MDQIWSQIKKWVSEKNGDFQVGCFQVALSSGGLDLYMALDGHVAGVQVGEASEEEGGESAEEGVEMEVEGEEAEQGDVGNVSEEWLAKARQEALSDRGEENLSSESF